jgi:hypothetical protein
MMPESQAWELNVLKNLQASLEERGLKFHINPSRDVLPEFLGSYQPDAIAIDPRGGGIVIEIRRNRNKSTDNQLAQLSKRVASQKGWEFRVFYMNPNTEQQANIATATLEQIDAKLQEIRSLKEGGYYGPALIYGWSVLESLARLAGGPERSRGLSPIQAVQELAAEGYIENEEAQRLRDMARLRSAVVHGDFSVNVTADQIEFLIKQLETLRVYISKVEDEERSH